MKVKKQVKWLQDVVAPKKKMENLGNIKIFAPNRILVKTIKN